MKYALCLHGMAQGTTDIGNPVDYKGALPFFQKNVLEGHEVDVFCHSWLPVNPYELSNAYKAAGLLVEPQREFPGDPETRSIYSRWFSARNAVGLINGTYDGVLLARYDVVFRVPFPWDKLDTHHFWTGKWRQKPAADSGYLDYWFYGSQKDMKKMSQLYHSIDTFFGRGVKKNGHNVVDAHIQDSKFDVKQWGEQPEDFILLRRLHGATN